MMMMGSERRRMWEEWKGVIAEQLTGRKRMVWCGVGLGAAGTMKMVE